MPQTSTKETIAYTTYKVVDLVVKYAAYSCVYCLTWFGRPGLCMRLHMLREKCH